MSNGLLIRWSRVRVPPRSFATESGRTLLEASNPCFCRGFLLSTPESPDWAVAASLRQFPDGNGRAGGKMVGKEIAYRWVFNPLKISV